MKLSATRVFILASIYYRSVETTEDTYVGRASLFRELKSRQRALTNDPEIGSSATMGCLGYQH